MLSFLFFVIIFVLILGLVIILSVLGFLRSIFGSLFSFGKHKKESQSTQYQQQSKQNTAPKQKIFTEKEGEYVDYEEIE